MKIHGKGCSAAFPRRKQHQGNQGVPQGRRPWGLLPSGANSIQREPSVSLRREHPANREGRGAKASSPSLEPKQNTERGIITPQALESCAASPRLHTYPTHAKEANTTSKRSMTLQNTHTHTCRLCCDPPLVHNNPRMSVSSTSSRPPNNVLTAISIMNMAAPRTWPAL